MVTWMADTLLSTDFVEKHREDLSHILRNSSDPNLRAVAGALLILEGDTLKIDQVKRELEICEAVLG